MDWDRVYPLAGRIAAVEDAAPGDTLAVEILDLRTRGWGWTAVFPGSRPAFDEIQDGVFEDLRHLGRATYARFGDEVAIPLTPFMGTMGVCPADASAVAVMPPGRFGGNMDDAPARARHHALPAGGRSRARCFSTGDAHGCQGDGEVCVTGLEAPMYASLRFSAREGPRASPGRSSAPRPARSPRAWIHGAWYGTTGVGPDLFVERPERGGAPRGARQGARRDPERVGRRLGAGHHRLHGRLLAGQRRAGLAHPDDARHPAGVPDPLRAAQRRRPRGLLRDEGEGEAQGSRRRRGERDRDAAEADLPAGTSPRRRSSRRSSPPASRAVTTRCSPGSRPTSKRSAPLSVVGSAGYLFVVIAGAFLGYLSAGFVHDRLGRRKTFMLFASLAAWRSSRTSSCRGLQDDAAHHRLPARLLRLGLLLGFGSYLSELYPTRARGTARASVTTSGGVRGAVPGHHRLSPAAIGLGGAVAFGVWLRARDRRAALPARDARQGARPGRVTR